MRKHPYSSNPSKWPRPKTPHRQVLPPLPLQFMTGHAAEQQTTTKQAPCGLTARSSSHSFCRLWFRQMTFRSSVTSTTTCRRGKGGEAQTRGANTYARQAEGGGERAGRMLGAASTILSICRGARTGSARPGATTGTHETTKSRHPCHSHKHFSHPNQIRPANSSPACAAHGRVPWAGA